MQKLALLIMISLISGSAFAESKDYGPCTKELSVTSTGIMDLPGPYVPLICKHGKLKQMSSYEFTTLINGFYSKHPQIMDKPEMFRQLVELDNKYDRHGGAAGFTFRNIVFTDDMIKEVKAFTAVKFEMDADDRNEAAKKSAEQTPRVK